MIDDASQYLRLPERADDAHKNACGHVLAVAGSRSMPGAAALVGLAALRAGAGLVTVLTSSAAHPIVAGYSPCLMVVPIASDDDGRIFVGADTKPHVAGKTVVVLGPGLGRSSALQFVVRWFYTECPLPLVIDADGLNNLADAKVDLANHAGPRILTPHLGEFRRLTGIPDLGMEAARAEAAKFSARNQVVVVLKGPRSLICDGHSKFENTTGNPGLATAGTGDVLSGAIAGLIAQGLPIFSAAATGAYLHGRAGDLAAASLGMHSLIATDVIEHLPKAFQELAGRTE